jgi:hypothetical protein
MATTVRSLFFILFFPHLTLLRLAQRADQRIVLLRHRRLLGPPIDWLCETAEPSARMPKEARYRL